LRCPFGCRAAHRKQHATRRSTAYYRTKEGQQKKRIQNGKRRREGWVPEAPAATKADAGEWTAQMVEHVRMVASLIERRRVSLDEILKMLGRVLRQHSLVRRRRIDYIIGHLNKASP
jgi:hypothetical protein